MADEQTSEGTSTEETPNPFAETPEDDSVELLGQDDEGTPGEAQPSEVGDQPDQSKAEGHRAGLVSRLINEKYAGDEEKFLDGLHNQWNSSAEMHKELKALRAELAELKSSPKDPEEVFKTDPDLVSLSDQRDLVNQELETLEATASSIRESFAKLNEQLIREQVLAEKSDDYDKSRHEQKAEQLQSRIEGLKAEWGRLPTEQKRLKLQLKVIDNQITQAKSAVQSRSKSQKQQQESDEKEQVTFRNTVDSLIGQAIKDSKLPGDSSTAKRMDSYIRLAMKDILRSIPEDGPGIDPILVVEHYRKEFLEGLTAYGKQSFKNASTVKQNGKLIPSQPQQRAPLPGAKRVSAKDLTKDQIDAHHRRVFNLG